MKDTGLEKAASVSFPFRLFVLAFLLFACFAVLVAGLWRMQVVQGKDYRLLSEKNRLKLIPVDAPRGIIYDRKMRILVDNQPSFDAGIIVEEIGDAGEVAGRIGGIMGVPAETIMKKIENSRVRDFDVLTIKKDLDRETATKLEEMKWDIPGLVIELAARRNYVHGDFASHLLGYTGEVSRGELEKDTKKELMPGDYVGKSGVEKTSNDILSGRKGWKWRVVNAIGKKMPSTIPLMLEDRAPEPGDSVVLTIDAAVQEAAEEALGDRKGAVVALDPRNGEVLALASGPGFDPNVFSREVDRKDIDRIFRSEDNVLMDRSIQGQNPPGSIFKVVIALGALQEGVITPDTRFSCHGVYHLPGSRAAFRCWKPGGHGSLDLSGAIKNSCNVYFYHAGVKLGVDNIGKYARMLGFGSKTGIDLPFEAPGLVPSERWKQKVFGEKWYPGESVVLSIGQGFLRVTPLQVAVAVSTIANGGTVYRPRIIKGVLHAGGRHEPMDEPEVMRKTKISADHFAVVREGMRRVVCEDGGTARRARIEGIQVAGKTGTAQTVSRGSEVTGEKAQPHAWFAGFAPFENPRVAVVVYVENGGYGGSTAAPVAAEVIRAAIGDTDEAAAGNGDR